MYSIAVIINYVVKILKIIILIRVLISWLAPYSNNSFTNTVYALSEPILKPFRNLIPLRNIDVSPIIAFLVLDIIRRILFYILFH